nr:acyl carrier protein [Parafrankia sp. BMG5.11]
MAHIAVAGGLFPAAVQWHALRAVIQDMTPPMDRAEVDARIRAIVEPFNKKNVEIDEDTTFAGDLEFDSLTVMDFVAAIEDEFDIIISMNQQAEIESWGNLVDAVAEMQDR